MKKVIIVLFLFTILINLNNKTEEYIIPADAIRFRVIANSNTIDDQNTKIQIKNNIENLLSSDILKSNSKTEAKQNIKNRLFDIEKILNNYQVSYKINLGQNYFPEKTYKGVTYPEGMYESLVVTLGSGSGENWWCVLYPPLCLMDGLTENQTDIEYKSFVQEIFKKYL